MKFTCSTCGEDHDLSEISFGADAPFQWEMLSDAERGESLLTPDQCVIESSEGTGRYIRACLEIPIQGQDKQFTWGVWCSLSETSFDEMHEHWRDPDRIHLGPYFGWFCTRIPGYPDTMYLKTMVHQRDVGQRPTVELEPTDHPLAVHQRQGVDPQVLRELVVRLLHDEEPAH